MGGLAETKFARNKLLARIGSDTTGITEKQKQHDGNPPANQNSSGREQVGCHYQQTKILHIILHISYQTTFSKTLQLKQMSRGLFYHKNYEKLKNKFFYVQLLFIGIFLSV